MLLLGPLNKPHRTPVLFHVPRHFSFLPLPLTLVGVGVGVGGGKHWQLRRRPGLGRAHRAELAVHAHVHASPREPTICVAVFARYRRHGPALLRHYEAAARARRCVRGALLLLFRRQFQLVVVDVAVMLLLEVDVVGRRRGTAQAGAAVRVKDAEDGAEEGEARLDIVASVFEMSPVGEEDGW